MPGTAVTAPQGLRMWYLYILECADGSYYSGITTDPERRLREHNGEGPGAKYTRARRPVKLVYKKKMKDRSSAAREEWRIKQLSRREKDELVDSYQKSCGNDK
jgi:putative endonuclease